MLSSCSVYCSLLTVSCMNSVRKERLFQLKSWRISLIGRWYRNRDYRPSLYSQVRIDSESGFGLRLLSIIWIFWTSRWSLIYRRSSFGRWLKILKFDLTNVEFEVIIRLRGFTLVTLVRVLYIHQFTKGWHLLIYFDSPFLVTQL